MRLTMVITTPVIPRRGGSWPGKKHQGNSDQLLGATFFSMISPAKFGRLVALNFCEVATGLLKATSGHFPPLIGAFGTFKVIGVFADVTERPPSRIWRSSWNGLAERCCS
jgi:hypothetical protein